MIKILLIGVLLHFTLGCKKAELDRLTAENSTLKTKVASLEVQIKELKNSDRNMYASAKKLYDEASKEDQWENSYKKLNQSMA